MMDAVKYNLGDTVYLRVSPEDPGMVTGIMFRPGIVIYKITWGCARETDHYDIELTANKRNAYEAG